MSRFKPNVLAVALASACACSAIAARAADEVAEDPAAQDKAAADPATPNDAAAGAEAQTMEGVTVTANRRVQSIQKYSGTVQAFSGDDLQKLAVNTDFTNLQSVVPGLQITRQEGKYEIFLRGIGSADSDFASDPSVATYYNGVYLPRPRSIGPMFFDIQSIEVNKGPQGTVRGRNATGGSINIIANKPEFDSFNGNVQFVMGNYGERNEQAVVNLPVTSTFALRAAVSAEDHDSYYKNAYPSNFEAPGAVDNKTVRLSGLWEPDDAFSAYVMADYSRERGTGDPGVFAGRALSAGYDVDSLPDPFKQYFRTQGTNDNDIKGILSTLTYHFNDEVAVEYNTSYRKYKFSMSDASREWQLGFQYPGRNGFESSDVDAYAHPERITWNDAFRQAENSASTINELRFYGDTGRLIWSAGLFSYGEKYSYTSWNYGNPYFGDCSWFRADTICGWENSLGGENRANGSKIDSNAAYTDLSFKVTDSLRVIGGIRYTKDKKTDNEQNYQYQFVIPAELFAAYGLTVNTGTNPYTTGINTGNSGFTLTSPHGRHLRSPQICTSFDPANLGCNGGADNSIDFFLDGIASQGLGDNFAQFLRRYRDQIQVIIRSNYPNGETTNIVKNDYVDWRTGLEYDLDSDKMLYGTVSTGTRSGGINIPLLINDAIVARTFKPEKLTVFEVGFKGDFRWGDMPVRFNAAAFYYDYKNKVVQNLIATPAPTPSNPDATVLNVFNDNAAKAGILGVELEGKFVFDHGLNLGYNFTYIDSQFKNSTILDTRYRPVHDGDPSNLLVNVDGNQLPNTSKFNLNLTLAQALDVHWGPVTSFDWAINALFRSKYYLTAFNSKGYGYDANGNVVRIPLVDMAVNNNGDGLGGPNFTPANGLALRDDVGGFAVLNVSAGLNFGTTHPFRIDGYIANVTDKAYSGKGFINADVNIRYLNVPRTFGVRFSTSF